MLGISYLTWYACYAWYAWHILPVQYIMSTTLHTPGRMVRVVRLAYLTCTVYDEDHTTHTRSHGTRCALGISHLYSLWWGSHYTLGRMVRLVRVVRLAYLTCTVYNEDHTTHQVALYAWYAWYAWHILPVQSIMRTTQRTPGRMVRVVRLAYLTWTVYDEDHTTHTRSHGTRCALGISHLYSLWWGPHYTLGRMVRLVRVVRLAYLTCTVVRLAYLTCTVYDEDHTTHTRSHGTRCTLGISYLYSQWWGPHYTHQVAWYTLCAWHISPVQSMMRITLHTRSHGTLGTRGTLSISYLSSL